MRVSFGLVRLGYGEEADQLSRRVTGTVASEGPREYYHPYTGRGMGAVQFAWSSLVLELLDPDARAASAYLDGAVPRLDRSDPV